MLISTYDLIARWAFEGTFFDDTNNYNAILINNPLFVVNGYVNEAIAFSSSSNQYLSTSYIPLASNSFTIEAWLYPTGFPNSVDHSVFGLCTSASTNQCLYLTIRNMGSTYRLYLGFYGDDCSGTTSVALNQWIHVAFVFDSVTLPQSIYLNGNLDSTCIATAPFTGSTGAATIGYIPGLVSLSGSNYFEVKYRVVFRNTLIQ